MKKTTSTEICSPSRSKRFQTTDTEIVKLLLQLLLLERLLQVCLYAVCIFLQQYGDAGMGVSQ